MYRGGRGSYNPYGRDGRDREPSGRPRPSGGGRREDPDEQKRKLFVGGLSFQTTKDVVHSHFSDYGQVQEVIMVPDTKTGRPRGFCFVIYEDEASVDLALSERRHNIDGRNVECTRAVGRDEVRQNPGAIRRTKRVYLARTKDLTEDEIRKYFEEFVTDLGAVEEVDLLINKATGQHRGFGFINFSTFEAADKVCMVKDHKIGIQDVVAIKAEPKGERPERVGGGPSGGGGGYSDPGDAHYSKSLRDLRTIMPPNERVIAPALQASLGRTALGAVGPTSASSVIRAPDDLRRLEEEIAIREEQLKIKEMKLQLQNARMATQTAASLASAGSYSASSFPDMPPPPVIDRQGFVERNFGSEYQLGGGSAGGGPMRHRDLGGGMSYGGGGGSASNSSLYGSSSAGYY